MLFRDSFHPTEEELREWATDGDNLDPAGAWELVLSWGIEPGRLRACVDLAADARCPKAGFFLTVLYQWVEVVARYENFEIMRSLYDGWLEVARGITDPAVKRWRYQARLIFQGIEPFDRERWWATWLSAKRGEVDTE